MILGERVPTEMKEKKKTENKKDDMVKVNDLDELKGMDMEEKPGDHEKREDKTRTHKGFAKRIFSRKSGSK